MFRACDGAFDGMLQEIVDNELHRQQLRVQVNQMSRFQNKHRVVPRPVRVEDRRPAPEDAHIEAAKSSAAQPTSSVVRTLEAEDDTSAKRWRLMAGLPTLHQTDENFNVDVHKMVVVAAMPDDKVEWTQRVIDWDIQRSQVWKPARHRRCTKVD